MRRASSSGARWPRANAGGAPPAGSCWGCAARVTLPGACLPRGRRSCCEAARRTVPARRCRFCCCPPSPLSPSPPPPRPVPSMRTHRPGAPQVRGRGRAPQHRGGGGLVHLQDCRPGGRLGRMTQRRGQPAQGRKNKLCTAAMAALAAGGQGGARRTGAAPERQAGSGGGGRVCMGVGRHSRARERDAHRTTARG